MSKLDKTILNRLKSDMEDVTPEEAKDIDIFKFYLWNAAEEAGYNEDDVVTIVETQAAEYIAKVQANILLGI